MSPGERALAILALATAAAVAVGGCELLAPIPDLTSGLTSPTDAGAGAHPLDAAVEDARSASDAAPPVLPPCVGDFLYCNSFESPADLVQFQASNVRAAIESDLVRVGSGALRLDLLGAPENGIFAYQGAVPLPPHVHFRFLVRFADGTGDVAFLGRSNYLDGLHVYVGGDGAWHWAQYGPSNDIATAIVPDLTAWHCIQLELDSTAGTATASLDGAGPFSLTLKSPTLPYDYFALIATHPGTKTLWFDELAFASHSIACPP